MKLLKPGPEIFGEAVRRAGVGAGECAFIDDMEENVRGAAAVGLRGILYRPETDLEFELKKLGLTF
jgi:2-haloacid dehalogenase